MKKRRILLTVLVLVMVLALVVALAACGGKDKKKQQGGKTDDPKKTPTQDTGSAAGEAAGVALKKTVGQINKAASDVSKAFNSDSPKGHVALDVALDVDIDPVLAGKHIGNLLNNPTFKFSKTEKFALKLELGVDVVFDKAASDNNAVALTIRGGKGSLKPLLGIAVKTENGVSVGYIGEALTMGEMNWMKLDYPQVDYVDFVIDTLAKVLGKAEVDAKLAKAKKNVADTQKAQKASGLTDDEKATLKAQLEKYQGDVKGYTILSNMSKGTFLDDAGIEGMLNMVAGLLKSIPILEKSDAGSDANNTQLDVNFAYIGELLGNPALKGMIGNLDLNAMFKGDTELVNFVNQIATILVGGPLDDFLAGKVEKQPKLSIILHHENNQFGGLGIKYDGTPLENGINLLLDIRNVVIDTAADTSAASAALVSKFKERTGLTSFDGINPPALDLEIDLVNLSPEAQKASMFAGLEKLSLAVKVRPKAKLGWFNTESDPNAKYFAANLQGTYAYADLTYKHVGTDPVTALVATWDAGTTADRKTTGNMRIDLGPVYDAFKLANKPAEAKDRQLQWNFNLTDEIEKAVRKVGKPGEVAAKDYAPAGLMNSAFGTFINEIVDKNVDAKTGNMIAGVQSIVNEVALKIMQNAFGGISYAVTEDNKTVTVNLDIVQVYEALMAPTGFIGGAGISYPIYEEDASGNLKKDASGKYIVVETKTLVDVIGGFKLTNLDKKDSDGALTAVSVYNFINNVIGAKIYDALWKMQEGDVNPQTKVDLVANRSAEGIKLTLTGQTELTAADESKFVGKVEASLKLKIFGEAYAEQPAEKKFDDAAWTAENVTLFGSNNYDTALTCEQHNAWKTVLNTLLNTWAEGFPVITLADCTPTP